MSHLRRIPIVMPQPTFKWSVKVLRKSLFAIVNAILIPKCCKHIATVDKFHIIILASQTVWFSHIVNKHMRCGFHSVE